MDPKQYRRKVRAGLYLGLLALSLGLRLAWSPALLVQARQQALALLGGAGLQRAVVLLETGRLNATRPQAPEGHSSHGSAAQVPEAKAGPGAEGAPKSEPASSPEENAAPEAAQGPGGISIPETASSPEGSSDPKAASDPTENANSEAASSTEGDTNPEAAPSPEGDTSPEAAPSPEGISNSEASPSPEADRISQGASAASEAPAPFTPEEAEAIQLRGSCTYQVDKAELLLRPLGWDPGEGPRVLVIHSHSCESYTQCEGHTYVPDANFRTLDLENNVVAVGDALTRELEALGVEVIHDRTYNDYPSYNSSYANARQKILGYLEEYPSLRMVIDLHRDALDKPVRETAEIGGQTLAPLMLVVGTDEGGLSHPHWADNLSCGLKLQALANRDQPGLFKSLSFRKERFNGDLTPGSLIVEVGSTENTLPEAVASMPCLARYVAQLLQLP